MTEIAIAIAVTSLIAALAMYVNSNTKCDSMLDRLANMLVIVEGQDRQLEELKKELEQKKAENEETRKQVERWNTGLENILNYSVETAKGDKK